MMRWIAAVAVVAMGCSDDVAPVSDAGMDAGPTVDLGEMVDKGDDTPETGMDAALDVPMDAGKDVVIPDDEPLTTEDGGVALGLVQREVFTPRCAIASCHGPGGEQAGRLDLQAGRSRASLLGVEARGVQCGGTGRVRVVAGDVGASLLFEKVSSDRPACGSRMPQGGARLSEREIGLIREWIAGGAR